MTQIKNNHEVAEQFVSGIEKGADQIKLKNNTVSQTRACEQVATDQICASSYSSGCSLMGELQTHVLHTAEYVSQISLTLEQADAAVVQSSVAVQP